MALTPHQAAEGKVEQERLLADALEKYFDEALKAEYFPGGSVTVSLDGIKTKYNDRVLQTVRKRFEAAGWQTRTTSHMNESFIVFKAAGDRPNHVGRC